MYIHIEPVQRHVQVHVLAFACTYGTSSNSLEPRLSLTLCYSLRSSVATILSAHVLADSLYMYTCVHACMCTDVGMYVCMYEFVYVPMYLRTYVGMHVFMFACLFVCMCACVYMFVHRCI